MTVQTVRPDSTVLSTGGIVGVGGGVTIHGATSDASTTTGVTANGDNKYAVLGLANPGVALTGTQRVRAWRIRVDAARTAADLGHSQRAQVKLRDVSNRLSETDTIDYNSTAVKQFVGPWRPNAPGKQPWNNTNLNNMRMDVVWPTRVNNAVEWLEVRGLFVDFDYNDQPTVSGVDLTGFTTTSFPDVIWTTADADGDLQTAFQVKVFITGDTVVGGFNPETSTLAKWDSGIRTGNAQNITVEKALLNGTQYTAYVKVAQAWSGPEGPLWWSTWVAGTARTVSLTPPAAVTVVTTQLTTQLPDYKVLHTITAGSPGGGASNEIQLQQLEKLSRVRGDFYNWLHPQISSCGGVTMDTSGFYSRLGVNSFASLPLDTVSPATGDTGGRMIAWNPSVGPFSGLDIGAPNAAWTDDASPYLVPCVPGVPTRVSWWVRARSGSFTTRIIALGVDANNATIVGGGFNSFSPVTVTTTWQRMELAFTPIAGTVYLQLSLENSTPVTGVEILLHAISVGPDRGAGMPHQEGIGIYLATPPDTSWTDVRHKEIVTGIPSGGKVYIGDDEVIPGRPKIYRARSVTVVSGQTVSGPWTYYNAYTAPPATTLMRDPYDKEQAVKLKRDGRTSETIVEDSSVFHAVGRDRDPIVMSDWQGGADGKMTIYWETIAERRGIENLVRSGRPVLVQWHDGGARYVRFGSREFTIWDKGAGVFEGEFVETDRP